MRPTKLSTLALAAALAAVPLAACGGSSGTSSAAHPTLTYWATNQGTSLQDDRQVLGPQIAKFTKQTGIKVNFEVIPWTNVLNQITAATVSGKGPDVLNIGNTWSPSLQATGALLPFTSSVMSQIGGSSRFLAGSLSATGAPGKPPTAVPLYSLAYGLYYNKALFAAVKQMMNFIQTDKITNPSDAQYSKGTEALVDYATGKTAMVIWQAASGSLKQLGMNAADIGVAPVPLPSPMPSGGKTVTSMVAGINMAVFKNTKNMSAALQFVKFMTSTPEQ